MVEPDLNIPCAGLTRLEFRVQNKVHKVFMLASPPGQTSDPHCYLTISQRCLVHIFLRESHRHKLNHVSFCQNGCMQNQPLTFGVDAVAEQTFWLGSLNSGQPFHGKAANYAWAVGRTILQVNSFYHTSVCLSFNRVFLFIQLRTYAFQGSIKKIRFRS